MKRAGRRTIRKVRRERRAVLRKLWWRYLVIALVCAVGAAGTWWWLGPMLGAFFLGVYVTAFAGLVAYSLMLDGSHYQMMGAEAERWTSKELRRAGGWWVIDGVEFADTEIDHVAVGPNHVLTVETKWTSREVTIDANGVHGLWCDGVGQARRSARKVRNFLGSKGAKQPVIPLLVLWGPKVARIPGGYQRVGEVRVVVGVQAEEWRQRLAQLPRWSSSTAGVPEILREYVRGFDRRRHPARLATLRRRLRSRPRGRPARPTPPGRAGRGAGPGVTRGGV